MGSRVWDGHLGGSSCVFLPPGSKQTIDRADMMAVIQVVTFLGATNRELLVATDSEYVYSGIWGSATRWRAPSWVGLSGPVAKINLWISCWI